MSKRSWGGRRNGAGRPRTTVRLALTTNEAAAVLPWLVEVRALCFDEAAQPVLDRLIAELTPGSTANPLAPDDPRQWERDAEGRLLRTTDDLANDG